jgi:hypothetical protein
MTNVLTMDNLREVFSYPFRDTKWIEKFLIGSLISLGSFLILPSFLLYGYFAKILRDAIEGHEISLPEWDDWEKKFIDGAKLFAVGLIYMFPLILFFIFTYVVLFAGALGTEYIDPYDETMLPVWTLISFLGTFGWMVLFGLGLFLSLIMGLFFPTILCHVIAKDDFSAAFKIKEWWNIFRANLWGFFISYLLILGLFFVLNFVYQILSMTIVLCCLAPFIFFPGSFYIMTTTGVLFGQAYRDGVQNLEA